MYSQATIPRRSSSGLLLLILTFAVALAILGSHATDRHARARDVPELFNQQGQCTSGSSAEFYSDKFKTWMYVCFLQNGRAAIWVLTARITEAVAREITAIPPNDIRNIATYLPNVINRYAYTLVQTFGNELPKWFIGGSP